MIGYILVGAMLLGGTPVSTFNSKCALPFYDYVDRVENYEKISEIQKLSNYDTNDKSADETKVVSTNKKKKVEDKSDYKIKVPAFCKWSKLKWEITKGVYGKISIPTIGVSSNIVWGATQGSVDRYDIAISRQAGYCGGNKPVIIMGHNTKSFSKLKNIKVGSKVIIKTQYGVYIYKVYKTQIAKATQDGKNIVDSKGNKVIVRNGDREILQLYTCYDSNGKRFVAKCEKIKGTIIDMEE